MPPEAPISPSLLQDAQSLFISRQEVSISLLQRTFKVRHGQALGVVTQLVVANVVHPVNLAGFHILTDAYLTKAHYMHDPLQSHIRQLRDLSLYMVESIEEGHRGNSDAIKTILTTRPALWAEVRTRAIDIVNAGSPSPVTNLAFNLASMDALASAFTVEQVHYQLAAECSPFASRPAVPLEANEKKRRSYIRLVRYLEQRIIDGFNPSTLAFICFPLDVPFGRGSELVKVGGRSHREHVVPRLLLTNRCTEMLLAGVPLAQVARWVEPYVAVVEITRAEANKLDTELELKTCMPQAWEFDRDCIYDRLHKGGIAFSPAVTTSCCDKGVGGAAQRS